MEPYSNYFQRIEERLLRSAEVKRQTAEKCRESILTAAQYLTQTFRLSGKVLLCGNGGSAADCQHMAAEFVSRFSKDLDRPALPAIALTTDTSILTAISNDAAFEGVFERQVQALGRAGDLLFAISTSGNSPNVIRAVESAAKAGMRTVALTGNDGRLAKMTDVAISVPSADTQHIQEAHLAIEHVLCELVEEMLFRNSNKPAANEVWIGRAHNDH